MLSEIQIQANCHQWLWNTYPFTRRCFFHVPNGGKRSLIEATQLKASGVIAGIPDCLFVWIGKCYAFEFKTMTGTLSPEQKKVHEAWVAQGIEVFIIRSFPQFESLILNIL